MNMEGMITLGRPWVIGSRVTEQITCCDNLLLREE